MYKDEEGLAHILNHTKWGWGYVQIYTSYNTTFHPHGTSAGMYFARVQSGTQCTTTSRVEQIIYSRQFNTTCATWENILHSRED